MTDPISDMIIRIKNAGRAGLVSVVMPHSQLKEEIAKALLRAGYVSSVEKKGKKIKKYLELGLAYAQSAEHGPRRPKVFDVKRISKPSRRVYQSVHEMRPMRGEYGISVLSTPKGVMIERDAKKQNVGGEVLFKVFA